MIDALLCLFGRHDWESVMLRASAPWRSCRRCLKMQWFGFDRWYGKDRWLP